METLDFKVAGMTCDHCASSLQATLAKVQGIHNAAVSYLDRHATVAVDAGIEAEAVIQAIRAKGYDAQLERKTPTAHSGKGTVLKVVIIGSGLSYHNLRAFGPGGQAASKAFDHWLQSAVVDSSPAERFRHLLDWASAPSARMAHPREDHLVPLMVAVGAAEGESARCVYHEDNFFGGITVSSFMFGEGHAPS